MSRLCDSHLLCSANSLHVLNGSCVSSDLSSQPLLELDQGILVYTQVFWRCWLGSRAFLCSPHKGLHSKATQQRSFSNSQPPYGTHVLHKLVRKQDVGGRWADLTCEEGQGVL